MLGDQPALLVAEVPEGGVPLIADRQLRDDVVVAGPELVLEVVHGAAGGKIDEEAARVLRGVAELLVVAVVDRAVEARVAAGTGVGSRLIAAGRSEEHTSELQSHHDLVCRLLLEKKKQKKQRVNKVAIDKT